MNIKEKRTKLNITQAELAKITGLATHTFRRYELGSISEIKEQYILRLTDENFKVDEEHGILKLDAIIFAIVKLVETYNLTLVYLFRSYAKGT